MYPTVYDNRNRSLEDSAFWDRFAELPAAVESRLPTMDKTLDAYFDATFASVIEEWELLTETDLKKLESRLSAVTNEIGALYAEKSVLEKRANDLDALVTTLEEKV